MAANNQQLPNKRTTGFDCKFVTPPPSEYVQSDCPVCLQIIREPCQVTCCGKKYCKACIERIKDLKKACPTCKKEEFSSYPDVSLKQSLYGLKVYCGHKKEGCEWMGELRQLDDHFNTDPLPKKLLEGCQYVKIACAYNCGDEMQRKDIENHQNDHCPNRPFSCEYCGVYKATHNDVTRTHWPVCGSFPLPCPNRCSLTVQRQKIDTHIANDCPLTTINCDFHHAGCRVKLPRQSIPEHNKKRFLNHMSLLAALVDNLIAENSQLKARNTALELQVNAAPPIVNPRPLGPLVLTMTNYQQYKRDNNHWISSPVYTHPQGYKISLSVFASGVHTGGGTHVSVYLHFMKGEYDDILQWPFQGIVSFQLLDQANQTDHETGTVTYDDTVKKKYCSRVADGERSLGLGLPEFITHSQLKPKYLFNNTLLFQVYQVEKLT